MASGYPGANRVRRGSLSLLRSKSSEAETASDHIPAHTVGEKGSLFVLRSKRGRRKPQQQCRRSLNERVCGGCPCAMLILMEESPGYIIFILRGCRAMRGMGNCLGFRNSDLGFDLTMSHFTSSRQAVFQATAKET